MRLLLILLLAGSLHAQEILNGGGSGSGVAGVALSDDPTWAGNHLFSAARAQAMTVPYSQGNYTPDANVVFRPTPAGSSGMYYAHSSIVDLGAADLDNTEHIGYFSYLKMGSTGQTSSYLTAYDFLVDVPATGGTPLYTYGLRGNINNFLADNTIHTANFIGSLVSGGSKRVAAGLYLGGSGVGSELIEGAHINTRWVTYGLHIDASSVGGGRAIYAVADPICVGDMCIYKPAATEPANCAEAGAGSQYFDTTDQVLCVCATDGTYEWQKVTDMTTDCSIS